jgi:hypothetical protein
MTLLITFRHERHRKRRFNCYVGVRCRGNVFTEPLLRDGLHNSVVLLLRASMLRALPNNGRCLQSHRLATGLYATERSTKRPWPISKQYSANCRRRLRKDENFHSGWTLRRQSQSLDHKFHKSV